MNNIAIHFKNGLEYANFTATNVEPLEKAAKIVYRQIELVNYIFKSVTAPFATLSSQLKDACTVFETIKIFGSIKMFIVPEKNGHFLLTNPDNSWQKRLDRVTLLAHNAFKFVKGLNKFGFVQLGVMAKNAVGQLPIFNLLMDSLIVASSVFSTWDTVALGLPAAKNKLKESSEKLEKWQKRLLSIEYLKMGLADEGKKVSERYFAKLDELNKTIDSLTLDAAKAQAKLNSLQPELSLAKTLKEFESAEAVLAEVNKNLKQAVGKKEALLPRIELINNQDWKGLAEVLEESAKRPMRIINQSWKDNGNDNTISKVDFKIRKYEAVKKNDKINTNKAWLNIANSVGKIAVVGLAIAFSALNLWVLPTLIAVNLIGTAVDTIGWSKFVTVKYYNNVTVPTALFV